MSSPSDILLDGSTKWQELFKTHDFKGLSELYTSDCKVFPPGRPVCHGRGECEKVWEAMHMQGAERIHLHSEETITAGGNMAADRSRYVIYDKAGTEIDRGKYLVVWKNVEGKWYLSSDIFNSDFPKERDSKYEVVLASDLWEHYFRSKNFKSMAQLYSEDCRVFAPGQDVAVGREGCMLTWMALSEQQGVARIDLENLETMDMGDTLAADRSSYIMYNEAGVKVDHGKYVVLWKKLQGKWYIHQDIFNSDVKNY